MLVIHACSGGSNSAPVAMQYSPQQQQPVVVQPPQPAVVHDGGNSGFLSGLMMGHLLGGGSSGVSHYHLHTTVCSGQLKLATALEFFQYRFSDSFGGNPPL
ncbi:hypothetical protein [Enterobacter asburiae]|uniref:hypothetical protein n=1 Tax=Enterobacter asburiae TaxID=61645 RepID=UPI001E632331|nr:hypothetical protein [Enterobacter asburiae]MCE2004068.1 hypothetical protein [Enterobacter asburiae]